jgi:hypothetical protein
VERRRVPVLDQVANLLPGFQVLEPVGSMRLPVDPPGHWGFPKVKTFRNRPGRIII